MPLPKFTEPFAKLCRHQRPSPLDIEFLIMRTLMHEAVKQESAATRLEQSASRTFCRMAAALRTRKLSQLMDHRGLPYSTARTVVSCTRILVQVHFGFSHLMNGKDPLYLICARASIAEQKCITRIMQRSWQNQSPEWGGPVRIPESIGSLKSNRRK